MFKNDRTIISIIICVVVSVFFIILAIITNIDKADKKLALEVQTELKESYGDQINIWVDKQNRICFSFVDGHPFVYVFEVKEFYKLYEP